MQDVTAWTRIPRITCGASVIISRTPESGKHSGFNTIGIYISLITTFPLSRGLLWDKTPAKVQRNTPLLFTRGALTFIRKHTGVEVEGPKKLRPLFALICMYEDAARVIDRSNIIKKRGLSHETFITVNDPEGHELTFAAQHRPRTTERTSPRSAPWRVRTSPLMEFASS